MKQETIIHSKLWLAWEKGLDAVFPEEFYAYWRVIAVIAKTFDFNNCEVNIKPFKTDKGFKAISVSFPREEE